ncbi:MAG: phosphopentomutase [Ignavibacteriaceae bacterium]|nr:phosphopentomutase [Ignavibacteriaceae bacterium]
MNNCFLIVLDGVGIGELPDANLYGDCGSNTLFNISKVVNGLYLPNLQELGLGNISEIVGVKKVESPRASFGKMREISKGKDSTTGHWELAGLPVTFDFTYYPLGFPEYLTKRFLEKTGCDGFLGNKAASGTEIIKELGDEHCKTGFPIIYTSADSVFQIAAHEEIIPLDRLYEICKITREEVLVADEIVGRVIARPFIGTSDNFSRTTNRHDFSMNPHGKTVLNYLQDNSINTISVGKVGDLFNYNGISQQFPTKSNQEGCAEILSLASKTRNSFIFANLVDFDVYFGHRNDPQGFADALRKFDDFLPNLLETIDTSDLLIITADHGNDPTTPSTDHSREYVPILLYQKGKNGRNLGERNSLADVGKTVGEFFNVQNELYGIGMLND